MIRLTVNCEAISEDQVNTKSLMTFEDIEDLDSRTVVGTSPFSSVFQCVSDDAAEVVDSEPNEETDSLY